MRASGLPIIRGVVQARSFFSIPWLFRSPHVIWVVRILVKKPCWQCNRSRDGSLFALAGLWERWYGPQGKPVETCTILTTEANDLMCPLHDRMPVFLSAEDDAQWLNPRATLDALRALFVPYPGERMGACPVGFWVSDPKHEGPRCLEMMGA